MKAVIQRVTQASVHVDGQCIGAITNGMLVLLGFGKADNSALIPVMIDKIVGLRIFSDEQGKMNLTLADTSGSVLLVPQFTLYGNCNKGRRPGFDASLNPTEARGLFTEFVATCSTLVPTATGEFGANMAVSLCNDGPVTFIIDSAEWSVSGMS